MPKINPLAQVVLAAMLMIGFFAMSFLPAIVPNYKPDDGTKQVFYTLMALVASYYFGSSSESAKKNEVIAQQARTAAGISGVEGDPVETREVGKGAPTWSYSTPLDTVSKIPSKSQIQIFKDLAREMNPVMTDREIEELVNRFVARIEV